MLKNYAGIILVLFLCNGCSLFAQEDNSPIETNSAIENGTEVSGLSGMVVDETTTKAGQDFYFLFYSKWEAPKGAENFNVIISEKPLPRLGSQIRVLVDDYEVFQQFLQPKYDVIDEMSGIAVDYARNYLENFESIQKELQGDDLEGSGIF